MSRANELPNLARAKERAISALGWDVEHYLARSLATDVLSLHTRLVGARANLAMRLEQLGFSARCSAHGETYSETCGGCSEAWIVANYGERGQRDEGTA